jgi:hypothetical protein
MSKQSSIDWFIEQLPTRVLNTYQEEIEKVKAKHKQEIADAYDRKVVDGIQDWFVGNGIHYYELHYEGKSGMREYNLGDINQDYKFEDGV